MSALIVSALLTLAAQTPDGAGPTIAPVTPAPAADQTEPGQTPSSDPSPEDFLAPPQGMAGAETTKATPKTEVSPAPQQDGTASANAEEPTPPTAAAEEAPMPAPAVAKDKRDHWSGVFVSGVGAAVVVLGMMIGSVAGTYMVFKQLPFPGGDSERTGFTTSAVVGAVFCVLVGMTLVTVGGALVGVSFL